MADAATEYVTTDDQETPRALDLCVQIEDDVVRKVPGLISEIVKSLCSVNVYKKSKPRFEAKKSELLSTHVYPALNKIHAYYRSVRI